MLFHQLLKILTGKLTQPMLFHKSHSQGTTPLNVLLSNGRFPVSIDLARQLTLAGHQVFTVDSMQYHVCKFSIAVVHSYQVPAPRVDAQGFIEGVKRVIHDAKIDIVIPIHEEIFYLAQAAEEDAELNAKLFAPPFRTLFQLHSKWEFYKFLRNAGLHTVPTNLCTTIQDVGNLDKTKEWALKPVFGRAASKVHHLKQGRPWPPENLDLDADNHYIAQEWTEGQQYCTYSVLQAGNVVAFAVYPVEDTLDGSSCVYFQAVEHPGIREYVDNLANGLQGISGQLALDIIETGDPPQLLAIDCNPRATSGIHLYSRTPDLAQVMTGQPAPTGPEIAVAKPGKRRQVAPGMLMWKRYKADHHARCMMKQYIRHMARLMMSKDVIFSSHDLLPSLMQPFLLSSYYSICREKKLKLPDMFQWDLVWEPKGAILRELRRMFAEDEQ